ncbi:hypothetical protein BRC68_06800 [Halobacteriales archaeon QH_6_64_20]|nr:MAG: hypothetical protein BRC68_06800 [Halobacteriales archaeon QH_6_64_20]
MPNCRPCGAFVTHNCVAVFTPSGMTDVPVRPRCDDRVCNEMTVGVTGNAMRLSRVRPDSDTRTKSLDGRTPQRYSGRLQPHVTVPNDTGRCSVTAPSTEGQYISVRPI